MNQLSDEQVDNLVRFLGYGDVRGRYWFVGIEEAGDGEMEKNVRQHFIKASFPKIHDLADAHTPDKLNWPMTSLIPTWATMSKIVMRLKGEKRWADTQNVREYQANQLGRSDGETLLLDLLPLRKVGDRDWPNWDPFTRWESREKYLEAMHRIRIPLIANLWRQHKPRYTICYGRGYWSWFREVFDLPFRPIGSLPARAAFSGDSAVVLTHFFAPRAGVGEAFIDELARELEGFTR